MGANPAFVPAASSRKGVSTKGFNRGDGPPRWLYWWNSPEGGWERWWTGNGPLPERVFRARGGCR